MKLLILDDNLGYQTYESLIDKSRNQTAIINIRIRYSNLSESIQFEYYYDGWSYATAKDMWYNNLPDSLKKEYLQLLFENKI